ncbi:MAG: xanthine dehydrogenase accessory protein XdhC [Sulfitobacter sp.]|nr:xanthine dehydrogenase accessory protein XdhC [Sulfitobacter sp.]
MSAIWVEITATKGSAPRDAGTVMKVTAEGTEGTIGGGALEHRAIARAQALLASGGLEEQLTIPLGPGLGQCCGGAVTLRFTREERPILKPKSPSFHAPDLGLALPLWLWGAGHVGRAVVEAAPAHAFDITWVDDAAARFPSAVPDHVTDIVARDMPLLAARAPLRAHHLILTYAHDIDLALCASLLRRGAASVGLIGSDTKWARFQRRLRGLGLDPSPIICPIGDKRLGKAPAQIARGTLAALLELTQTKATG